MSNQLSSVVDQFYEAFGNTDLELLARIITEEFTVDLPELEHVGLDPEYRGLAGFKKLLADRTKQAINYTSFKEFDRMIDVDRVAVFGRTTGTAGAGNKRFAHDWVHLFRFDGHKIKLLKEYIDASEVSQALAP
jgi:ketosteroid isomerase-like protein